MNQDFVAWAGQGAIADRTKEHLGTSDRGIILMRKRFLDDMAALERGEDPKGIVRDAALNAEPIRLPIIDRDIHFRGVSMREMIEDPSLDPRRGYPFQVGQPDAVRRAWLEAMGFDPEDGVDLGAGFLTASGAAQSRRIWT
jgi:5,5'-dehydrodivanillate O-demethylase